MTLRRAALVAAALALNSCSGGGADTTVAAVTTPSELTPSTPPPTSATTPTTAAAATTALEGRRQLDPDTRCDECRRPDPAFDPLPGAEAVYGEIDGAVYHIEMPPEWNGTLLLWAHGFLGLGRGPGGFDPNLAFGPSPQSVGLPDELRAYAIEHDMAWAASTYRANGYVPALGVDELLVVKDLVAAQFGPPSRTFILGASMGGATAQLLAQEFPDEVDGALAYCGAIGNVTVLDYLAAWHSVAAWALGAGPTAATSDGLAAWAAGLGDPRQPTPAGAQFVAVVEALTGGDRPGFRNGLRAQWDDNFAFGVPLWEQVDVYEPGRIYANQDLHSPYDTTGLDFGALSPEGVDTAVLADEAIRFATEPAARENPAFGVATGALADPLLTLKDTGDLFTPISLEADYRRIVEAAGTGANYVDQYVAQGGHCEFTDGTMLSAFESLLAWVEDGTVPASGLLPR